MGKHRELSLTQVIDPAELPGRAATLAPALIQWAVAYADEIARDLTTDPAEGNARPTTTSAVVLEALLLTVHVVDRVAFQALGAQRRGLFMDSLLSAVHDELPTVGLPEVVLEEAYAEKQFHYSQFKKLFAEQNEPLKDTLCWEFGKLIVTRYGDANPVGAALIAAGAIKTVGAVRELLYNPHLGVVRDGPTA